MEKRQSRFKIIILLAVAVACIALFLLQPGKSEKVTVGQDGTGNEDEARLAAILGEIQGVGRVKVYFHYDEPTEKEADSTLFSDYFRQQGKTKQTVSGLLIVAEGAEDPFIRGELATTISRILQLPSHRVVIVPMKEEEGV